MANEQDHAINSSANHVSPTTFRPAGEFRWCYYLHLYTAKKTDEIWRENDGGSHPCFKVQGKRRLVFVRGYFEDRPFYGGDWCQIFQVTTKARLTNGKKKPNLKPLGQVLPDDCRHSYVQTIPERYPIQLLEQAGTQRFFGVDRMTISNLCKILDHQTYRSGTAPQ